MVSNAGNIDVIVNTDHKTVPFCTHGPALLFSKYDIQTGDEKRFYACSAFRDRKQCSFFQWETSQTSAEKASEDHTLKQRSQFTHKQFRKRFLHVKKLKKCDRNLCVQCGLLLLPGETDEHEGQGHSIKKFITKQMLRRPTELFAPFGNNKTYAQYLFSKATLDFVISTLEKLSYTHILCVGCPRIHEAIQLQSRETTEPRLNSLLLDLDERYYQMYPPSKFCRYNMFNHHFFDGTKSEEVFNSFITPDSSKRVAMVMDPPFGGMIEALAATVCKIEKKWQVILGVCVEKKFPVMWFFPYFMERRIIECCPTYSMLDYKIANVPDLRWEFYVGSVEVDYENHVLFTGNKGRKQGSPVRIFTNLPPADIALPTDDGYWFCEKCQRYSSKENQHCDRCEACTTKDGRTYIHCDKCGRCVKPSRIHCDTCNICDLQDHRCGKKISLGCHICGEMDHKRRDCPNKNSQTLTKSVKQSLKRKKEIHHQWGRKKKKKSR